jgi:hypothetical protein
MQYIKTNYALMKNHNLSLTDIENMYPWERLVYIDYIAMKIKEDNMIETDRLNAEKDMMNHIRRLR